MFSGSYSSGLGARVDSFLSVIWCIVSCASSVVQGLRCFGDPSPKQSLNPTWRVRGSLICRLIISPSHTMTSVIPILNLLTESPDPPSGPPMDVQDPRTFSGPQDNLGRAGAILHVPACCDCFNTMGHQYGPSTMGHVYTYGLVYTVDEAVSH